MMDSRDHSVFVNVWRVFVLLERFLAVLVLHFAGIERQQRTWSPLSLSSLSCFTCPTDLFCEERNHFQYVLFPFLSISVKDAAVFFSFCFLSTVTEKRPYP